MAYVPKVYRTDGGDRQVIASGGTLDVQSGATFKVNGTAVNLSGWLRKAIVFGDSGAVAVGTTPANTRIGRVLLCVDTLFNAGTPTVSVGDAGSAARHMSTAVGDLSVAGTVQTTSGYKYTSATAITATVTNGSSSAGAAVIFVELIPDA